MSLLEGERVVAFDALAPQERRMLKLAKEKLSFPHNPYSKSQHRVASVVWVHLESWRNKFHASPNIEVRPRGGACAEDGAVFLTFGAGHQQYAKAICVIDQHGDGSSTSEVPYPCPVSRGAIAELARESGLLNDFRIIMSTTDFSKVVVTTIGVLLPHAFDYP